MNDNKGFLTLKNNPNFILAYRIAALLLITAGLLVSLRIFAEDKNLYALFTYTIQSNLIVLFFFFASAVRTAKDVLTGTHKRDCAFCSVFSFSACIAIVVTFLIFWCYLAPSGWMENRLLSFRNLSIHLFCPALMVLDRILFCPKGTLKKTQVFCILIFPVLYVIEAFVLGTNHLVDFSEELGIDSYYIYPFLDYDAYGPLVFLFIAGLAAFFLGLSFLWYHLEKRAGAKTN